MKRGSFLWISTISSIGLFLPFINCEVKNSDSYNSLKIPLTLSKILNDESLNGIGLSYLKNTPYEEDKNKLENILLDNQNILEIESFTIRDNLVSKINFDFKSGNIIIIQGWILSITEARQCALFYLNN